jgi:hypothetical protein
MLGVRKTVTYIWSANGDITAKVRRLPLTEQLLKLPQVVYFTLLVVCAWVIYYAYGHVTWMVSFLGVGLLVQIAYNLWITLAHCQSQRESVSPT